VDGLSREAFVQDVVPSEAFAQDGLPSVASAKDGGEGGIRTPDTLLRCNCLAGSPVRPLQHLSAVIATNDGKRGGLPG
jgi:hypothetical protein